MVSPLGWGDALVGGYAVRLLEGDSPAECLRFGLGCGAANLVGYGAGVFSPADAEKFAKMVELEEVSAEKPRWMTSRRSWSSISGASIRS